MMRADNRKNLLTYLSLMLFALIGIVYGKSLASDFSNLRLWEVSNLFLMFIGFPFIFLQTRAGIPDFWQKRISSKNRFVLPIMIGIAFGILDLLVFKLILHPQPYDELPPFLQPFPYSLFLFISGAFEIEVFYRLIPITIILLFAQWYKKGKYFQYFFWTGAVLTSLVEPIEQMPSGSSTLIIFSLSTGFLMNFLQAILFKRAGFLSSLSVRLGHYLIWHILLGIYVQFVEL